MNLSALTIAYSPKSAILEEVIRNAMTRLLTINQNLIKKGMSNQIVLPILNVVNNTITLPSNISGVALKWNITLPPTLTIPKNWALSDYLATMITNEMLKSLVNIKAYNKSSDLADIYSTETETRAVLCAIQFNDSLLG